MVDLKQLSRDEIYDPYWYIYKQFLAHENRKIAHKNVQKSFIL